MIAGSTNLAVWVDIDANNVSEAFPYLESTYYGVNIGSTLFAWSPTGKPVVPSKRLGRHHAEAHKSELRRMRFHSSMAKAVVPCKGGWNFAWMGVLEVV